MVLGWQSCPVTLWVSPTIAQINLWALKFIIRIAQEESHLYICAYTQWFFEVLGSVGTKTLPRTGSGVTALPAWREGTSVLILEVAVSFLRATAVSCQQGGKCQTSYKLQGTCLGFFFSGFFFWVF